MPKRRPIINLLVISMLLFLLIPGSAKAEQKTGSEVNTAGLSADRETQGDWVGIYGKEGYYLVGASAGFPLRKLPDDVHVLLTDLSGTPLSSWWCFWDEFLQPDTDGNRKAALFSDETEEYRHAACLFDGGGIAVRLSLGETTKRVSLYMTDFDGVPGVNVRTCEVILFDEDHKEITSGIFTDYEGGIYVSADVTGNVTFEVQHIGGPNAVISAVFFDETQGPALNEKGKNGENAVQETPRTENGWNLKLSDGIVFSILFVILLGLMVATSAVREERKTK